jgi:hypothetical protein
MGSLGAVGRCFNWAGEDVSLTFEGKRLTNYPAAGSRGQKCYRNLLNTLQKEQALGKRRHTKATKRYQAIEVLQQPEAPPMYMIRAAARELLEWCDVPRTKEHYMAGYQLADTTVRPLHASPSRSVQW